MRNNYVDPSYHIERSVNKQGNQKENRTRLDETKTCIKKNIFC